MSKRKFFLIGAGAAGLGLAVWTLRKGQDNDNRPADSAPGNAAKRGFGMDHVVAAAVTIRAPQDRVIAELSRDQGLPAAMIGQPGAKLTPIDHVEGSDVLSWRTEEGDLVKLRVRPVRGGTFTTVTGTLALEGRRVGSAFATLIGQSPKKALRHALTELRMCIETGEVAVAGPTEVTVKG